MFSDKSAIFKIKIVERINMKVWIIAVLLNVLVILHCGTTSEKSLKENQQQENLESNKEDKDIPSEELVQKREKFCLAAKAGDIVTIQKFLQEGINPNFTYSGNNAQLTYSTPLEIASENNKIDIVKLLVKAKADINFSNEAVKTTPILYAVRYDHYDIAKYLIDNGAKVNIKSTVFGINNITPLHYAKSERVVRLLVDNGADMNAITSYDKGLLARIEGLVPLHVIASNGDIGSIKYLTEKGADKDVLDGNRGYTPLHHACESGRLEIVKFLIEIGADKNIKGKDGVTALGIAVKEKNKDIIKYLKKVGAK